MLAPLQGILTPLGRAAALSYFERVRSIAPANLIGYWPQWGLSGSVAANYSSLGAAANGAITGGTLGNTGIGDGRTSWAADGSGDVINIYSASLVGAFNGAAGTLLLWGAQAASWASGTARLFRMTADAQNIITCFQTAANTVTLTYLAGNVTKSVSVTGLNDALFHCFALTWDKPGEAVRVYHGGVQFGTTQTTPGVWAGTLATATIGASDTTPTNVFNGSIAHVALWSTPLTPAQILQLSRV